MKNYSVKFENRANWNTENDVNNESAWIVSEVEIQNLAAEWGVDVDELMEQVEEI